jgi:Extracellular link domain
MIENYTDKATKYADQQRNLAATGASGNTKPVAGNTKPVAGNTKPIAGNTVSYSSPTNSIPPNYSVNGNINTDHSYTGNVHNRSDIHHEGLFYSIFNKSNIILVVWFLAIYFIAYFVLGFFLNKGEDVSNHQLRLSRTIDIISLFLLLVIIISTYGSYTSKQKESILQNTATGTKNFIDDPMSIFSTILFLVAFYIIVYLFRIPMDRETKPIVLSIVESIAWILLVIIGITDFFKYVLGISFTAMLSRIFDWSSLPDNGTLLDYGNIKGNINGNISGNIRGNVNGNISGNAFITTTITGNVNVNSTTTTGNVFTSQPVQKEEVFNISNNLYTYDDAQSICSSYGAKLANYDQIEDAYKNGGEWCNYGWSDGQMAFFPTQKYTWQALQKDPATKNNCGRPGINGGYFANPYIKFGVNCYGKKPNPTDADLERLKTQQGTVQPKTEKDSVLDKKVQFWKDNADKLVINSYNNSVWSEY